MKSPCLVCERLITDESPAVCKNKEKCHQRFRTKNLITPRNYEIYQLYVDSKASCEIIGDMFNLTRERIRQIVYTVARKLIQGGRVATPKEVMTK